MSAVPAEQFFGLDPKILQLVVERTRRTRVQYVFPRYVFVYSRVAHMGQQPVRSQLNTFVSRGR